MGYEFIGPGYECPSYYLCEGSWKIDNQEKWDKISSNTKNNIPFSTPLAPYVGLSYAKSGLMLISINFNFGGDKWDAGKGPIDSNHRLDWRRGKLFSNAEKLINCIFSIPNKTDYADHIYAFANIVKCSPHNKLSRNSEPNWVQFQQCICVREHILHEIEELNPGLILCLGNDIFQHLLTIHIEKRLRLGQDAKVIGRIAKIYEDTVVVGVPHLSGGILAINKQNKNYRAGDKDAVWGYPVLANRSYDEAVNYLKENDATWFDQNIILTAMAFEIREQLTRSEPVLYERIQRQLQLH